jgi:hypothetical protein
MKKGREAARGGDQQAQPSDKKVVSEDTTGAKKNKLTEKAKDRPRQSTACLEKEGE